MYSIFIILATLKLIYSLSSEYKCCQKLDNLSVIISDYNNKDRNYKIFFQNKLFNVSNLSTSCYGYLIATL